MKITTLAAYLFCAAAMVFLGRFELHTDDTGVEVFFILAITFVLGCLHPRYAWQWAVLVGLSIPAAHVIVQRSTPGWLVAVFVIAVGMAGSYAGVAIRRVIWPAPGPAR